MNTTRDLPQAELEVMTVLWQKGEATIREIWADLPREPKLAYTTVATMLSRLKEKGFVEAEEQSFKYIFRPLVPRQAMVHRKLDDLINKLLAGDTKPIAAYIGERKKLTKEQVSTLEDLLKIEAKS